MVLLNRPRHRAPGSAAKIRSANKPDVVQAARAGFVDAAAGAGFRPEYDCATKLWQWNYELGRLWALHAKTRGAVPAWPETTIFPRAVDGVRIDYRDECRGIRAEVAAAA